MRLSELRGILTVLEYQAHQKGNIDPLVELFSVELDGDVFLTVDINAIQADPAGQLTPGGSIHLPLKEITTRGYVVVYGDKGREDCIVIQATNKKEAEKLFLKHFSTYELKTINEEI